MPEVTQLVTLGLQRPNLILLLHTRQTVTEIKTLMSDGF